MRADRGHGDARRRDGHDDGARSIRRTASRRPTSWSSWRRSRRSTAASTRATCATKGRRSSTSVRRGDRRSASRAGMPVEIFHLKARYAPGWGMLMAAGGTADRGGARARRGRRRGHVRLHGRRHRARDHDPELGVRGRRRSAHGAARGSRDPRAAQARGARRLARAGGTSSRPAGGWDGSRARERAQPEVRRIPHQSIAQIGAADGQGSRRRRVGHRVARGPSRVMAIYHMMGEPDIETALRFPWTSIGSDAGAAREVRRDRRDRAAAPARLRQLPARDRRVRQEAPRAHARGGGAQDDVVAGDADAARRPRRDRARAMGPTSRSSTTTRSQDRATYEQPTESPTGID